MRKLFYLLFLGISISSGALFAQEILPGITVKNYNGKIIVSWKNQYPLEVKTINIQRSFDSSKNYTTIGSVLNPQNIENGFVDETPPYNKMYYRLFISFDAGAYIFSDPVRPVKEALPPLPMITQDVTVVPLKKEEVSKKPYTKITVMPMEEPERTTVSRNDNKIMDPVEKNNTKEKKTVQSKVEKTLPVVIPDENAITYPSRRIYAARDNNVIINLPHFESKKYIVKFFDEDDRPLFELNKIKEEYLIVEKMNFLHAGWFHFEIFENGKMIEKNKFFIAR
ncbi:MAG: hypothetical protein ABI666_00270 [Ferruginibacter sp.]